MSDRPEALRLAEIDPQLAELIAGEERRQREKIILIPSESLTPPAVREALASVLTSVYAEGYPRMAMRRCSPDQLARLDEQMASHRRYADWRFYKGTEYADLVESLAGRRAAACFATADYPAERILANVQPLSGAAANLAVYEALVEPGDTVMGMDLTEGGHLTHGSEFNITGKRYRIVSYAADRSTGKLDYDAILRLAKARRPRMIIGGFTSFPWQPDWMRFREIADEVGAILLADVAHTAGMIVGGVYPNPIGIADVVTFTTHKTLCGPRGAVILSTNPEIAARIDNAVFPGEQGGPHVNKFAAIAVALEFGGRPEFADLQRRIVENAAHLAAALRDEGLTLAYGGTDTHLLVIDLRPLRSETGFTMMGEIASRVLDLVGIVCNKNTIPGDHSAADAHGIRFGTTWPTQRGMGKEEMTILAQIVARVVPEIRPFAYRGLRGDLSRGKLPLSVFEAAKRDVRELIRRVDPHPAPGTCAPLSQQRGILRIHGGRVRALLNESVPADLLTLPEGTSLGTHLFDETGKGIAGVVVGQIGDEDYLVLTAPAQTPAVKDWLAGLADGYILFDERDVFRKVQGPAVVEEISSDRVPETARHWLDFAIPSLPAGGDLPALFRESPEAVAVRKPYFVGQHRLDLSAPDPDRIGFAWKDETTELKRTPLFEEHVALGAKVVPFAGWEMPVWYTSALEEHRAVREAAGLFDLGHMGIFDVSGEHATEFLNVVTSNYAAWLTDGESQYTFVFDPDGRVIDDVMVYRRAPDRYLLVANAVNEAKDWAWLNGVNDGRFLIDREIPARSPGPHVSLRDLKEERRVTDVALQGPKSPQILANLLEGSAKLAVAVLRRTEFCEVAAQGHQLLVSRTGYTGEQQGYEIYAADQDATWLWRALLEAGAALGLKPCGLAARDSTRTEAGLPLYGHELAGPHQVGPQEAGYASYVKLHKPFFVGRAACVTRYTKPTREIARFRVTQAGARPIRIGAAVVDRSGEVVGRVTSCVALGKSQIGLAILDRVDVAAGTPITLLTASRQEEAAKPSAELSTGDHVAVPTAAEIVDRFPAREETAARIEE